MADLNRVIVGNVVIHGAVLRKFLKKSHYWLSYDSEKEIISLCVNDGGGGETILEIRNASYENAVKLAKKLGLGDDGSDDQMLWHKWNPSMELHHDGSPDAESIRMELLRVGMPFKMYNTKGEWGLAFNGGMHTPSGGWKLEAMLQAIRDGAERYKKQLDSLP